MFRHGLIIGRSGQLATALTQHMPGVVQQLSIMGRGDLDLANPVQVRERILALRPDVILNAAAYTGVDDAELHPEAAMALNATGPGVAAAAAAELGAPMLHVSTDYVFDGSKGAPYLENDPTCPLGVYGASKLAGERAVAAANPDHVILRTAWLCSSTGSNFVRTILRLAEERDEIGVVDDQRGRPTFATDLAKAMAAIVQHLATDDDPSLRGVFHLSGADDASWFDFATAIVAGSVARGGKAVAVRPISTADYPTRARRPVDSRLDCQHIRQAHGVVARPWRDGLADCLDQIYQGRPTR